MFNPALDTLNIAQLGERIAWWRASPCSCYDPATNYDGQAGCDLCEHGYIYRQQKADEQLRGIVEQVRREHIHPDFGVVQVGDLLLMTMPDEVPVSTWDKIVLLDREYEDWDRLVKGSRDSITNPGDYVGKVREVSDSGKVYGEGEDWEFTSPDTITWLDGGSAPSAGVVYAVLFVRRPTFWYVGGERTGARPSRLSKKFLRQTGKLVKKREEA